MRSERGFVLPVVLMVCLAVAVVAMALSELGRAAADGRGAEVRGRSAQERAEAAMSELLLTVASGAQPATGLGEEATVEPVAGHSGRLWDVGVACGEGGPFDVVTVMLERGRDGIDLPAQGLVAAAVTIPAGRSEPIALSLDGGVCPVVVETIPDHPPSLEYLDVTQRIGGWRLDPATRLRLDDGFLERNSKRVLKADGAWVHIPGTSDTSLEDRLPLLVVGTPNMTLDLRDRGALEAVVVADGDVFLDGTTIIGAVYTSGKVDFGDGGRLVFDPEVRYWATDASTERWRLIPGSRREYDDRASGWPDGTAPVY